ncbi:hypothetical protein MIPYR_20010 [uncultured Microbacterium sp.]|uniref:Uncharacterized protein n=1 Tax=uncultured Microbacterium sp. TaxID=191216 RepID=A0A1Y5NYF5_9MICO|nr:hypothetical protein MIPYR_20010 [uncultured Microbacterium sp.]
MSSLTAALDFESRNADLTSGSRSIR